MIKKVTTGRFTKLAIFLLAAMVLFTTVLSVSASAYSTRVDTLLVTSDTSGYTPTEGFSIPEGDNKLTISINVSPKYGSPASVQAVLEKKTIIGWSKVDSANVPADGKSRSPWGVLNVKSGEVYRVKFKCLSGGNGTIVVDIGIAFWANSF